MDTQSFPTSVESVDIVIIGGGQAGLVLGYHLTRAKRNFVILDAESRVGDGWRRRWTRCGCSPPPSTTASRDAVPGRQADVPHKGRGGRLPRGVCNEVRASGPHRDPRGAGAARRRRISGRGERPAVRANSVVLATGGEQLPFVPEFADRIGESILQAALQRLSQPGSAAPRYGSRRGGGKLRRGDRPRAECSPTGAAGGRARGRAALPSWTQRRPVRTAAGPVRRHAGAHLGDAHRPEVRRPVQRASADPHPAARSRGGGGDADAADHRRRRRPTPH